ncbi:alpha-rhamnosidase [Paenibacillus psychroresistens]|uniref:Alpha-rhamnosidase n=1 Tax=Paenibacillus psychroresistens TaxID=1778678 RepID=A0A6B8RI73_9BACL|nr:family 78 glycoside hydrolase catalytic domain [Paenibacillus psychroresistens]QGQ95233.1 alpha-rhamnosidase [Paenibacillus psychroresistens]
MNQQAEWIWYPGDFEVWLNEKISVRRKTRGAIFPPFWRLDQHYRSVVYRLTYILDKEEEISINTEGEFAAYLSGFDNQRQSKSTITLPAGNHTLLITVYNSLNVPALYISGKSISTGSHWEVSHNYKKWVSVGKGSFYDSSLSPSQFRLETSEQQPLIVGASGETGLIADFGKETFGYLQLHNLIGNGTVTLYYGESLEEANDKAYCETIDIIEVGSGISSYTNPFSRAFRYVNIEPEAGSNIRLGSVSMLYEYAPVEYYGQFRSSNERLNQIWDTSIYTLHLNTREFFFDGIKRDRWVWSGDAYQSFLMNYYSFFDQEITKRTLIALRGKNPVETHINTILDYSFYWFISIQDYYMYTGDEAFIRAHYDNIVVLMDFCLTRINDAGMVEGMEEDWVFVDWNDLDNRGEVSVIQILFCRSLEAMSSFASIVEDKAREIQYSSMGTELKKKLFETFWKDDLGGFVHQRHQGVLSTQITKYPNMFAVLYGYLDAAQSEKVRKQVLVNDEIQKIKTPYMRFFELAALCEIGEHPYVMGEILDYWGGMLDLGVTTFWEEYNPKLSGPEHYAMYGSRYGKSLCHAWGASPIYLLGKYFLGVSPLTPGYQTYVIQPHLGGLEWIEGTVPTALGDLNLYMDKLTIKIQAAGGKGYLRILSSVVPICMGASVSSIGEGSYEVVIDKHGYEYHIQG